MTDRQLKTLKAIKSRLESLAAKEKQHPIGQGFKDWGATTINEAEQYYFDVIGCDARYWELFGAPPTASQSASHSRTMRQLEELGLVERSNYRGTKSRQKTHVLLTQAGLEALGQESVPNVNREKEPTG